MNIIELLYGLGVFQGITLMVVLLSVSSVRQTSNRIMALMIAVLTLELSHNWMVQSGYFLISPKLALIHLPLDYLVGPMLYFYGLSLTQQSFKRVHLLHFIPALLATYPTFNFYLLPQYDQGEFLKYVWYREFSFEQLDISGMPLSFIWDIWIKYSLQGTIFMVHVGIYCLMLHRVIKLNRMRLKTHYSSIEEMDLRWLSNLNIALIAYLTIFFIFNRVPRLFVAPDSPANFDPNLILVAIIQIIAILSLRQPNLIHGLNRIRLSEPQTTSKTDENRLTVDSPSQPLETPVDNSQNNVNEDQPVSAELEHSAEEQQVLTDDDQADEKLKYKRSGLDIDSAQEYRIIVMKAMQEQKLYLDCELTLNDLAEGTDIPSHQLSEVLNGMLNQNFYSFVNDYRVQYAQELLTNPETNSMAIIDLAFEAGFRSKSSFYDSFKKATSMTPSQYKKEYAIKKKD